MQLTVGLQVVVSYSQQLQDGLIKEGLNVTRLTVSGPDPYPNETVADQIVQQLGEPSIWTRYRWAAHPSFTFTHQVTCNGEVTSLVTMKAVTTFLRRR